MITQIQFCKNPVQKLYVYASDKMGGSETGLKSQMKDLGRPVHAYVKITFFDDTSFILEKETYVRISKLTKYDKKKKAECGEELKGGTDFTPQTLLQVMRTAEIANHCLYYYGAAKFNCQDFIMTILRALNLEAGKLQTASDFLFQPFKFGKKGISRTNTVIDLDRGLTKAKRKTSRFFSSMGSGILKPFKAIKTKYKGIKTVFKGDDCDQETLICHSDCHCDKENTGKCIDKISHSAVCPSEARAIDYDGMTVYSTNFYIILYA